MNIKELTEQEIRTRYITPAIQNSRWKFFQMREEFTLGRIHSNGKFAWRGENKRADYVLFYKKDLPLAIIEAKDATHSVGAGMQQALEYAACLDVPFVFSSNGEGFLEHDLTKTEGQIEKEFALSEFPSPEELWQRYTAWKNLGAQEQKILMQPYYPGEKSPRYYQRVAINRSIEAIAKGENRILLVMATGTGKTYTAFQIMWRLWKAKIKKRILFLADRNILVDQAKNNDFQPFGEAMTKISKRTIDKSFEIYLSLYQAVTGTEEEKNIYKEFSRDFFDLIVIDECHRGSAAEDSAWREILEYFSSATQIGLTATPKETKTISNSEYFGDPIFTYSLKEGIEDGFLAPYRLIRYQFDKDEDGWSPENGQLDIYGNVIPEETYFGPDFDKKLIIDERTTLVAKLVTDFIRHSDPYQKTIVFCQNIDHAERMRQALINENGDLVAENYKYVMRITGDSPEGKAELDSFIDPAERYPVIATTSKLLNTGVDVQTCKLIVLDININSMTEFKQIIGRGTRLREDYKKYFFTIIDFRNATRLFNDPDFDGDPVSVYEGSVNDPVPYEILDEPVPEEKIAEEPDDVYTCRSQTYRVNGVNVYVLNKRVQFYGDHGELVTESLTDFSRKNICESYPTLQTFLKDWEQAERKDAIVEELSKHGIFWEELEKEVGGKADNLDPFDLICHVAYDKKPLTRSERARNVRQRPEYFEKYQEKARSAIDAILAQYADQGYEVIREMLEGNKLQAALSVPPFNQIGRPIEIIKAFGGRKQFGQALLKLQEEIYRIDEEQE